MGFIGRTDLAIESGALTADALPEGIRRKTRQTPFLSVSQIDIETPEAAEKAEKPMGSYVTLSLERGDLRTAEVFESAAKELAEELRSMLGEERSPVLVACLGNRDATPDAIGPLAASHIIATRHLIASMPDCFAGFRPVCVLAPGVLGSTGFESAELIEGAVKTVGAKAVIAVDALAALGMKRLCRTVQITDTGIEPGSGVGNRRAALNRETLGVKVIALGVPTVIDAASMAADVLRDAGIDDIDEKRLEPHTGGLIVTPKDIDARVKQMARLLGYGINMALQPELGINDIADLLAQ